MGRSVFTLVAVVLIMSNAVPGASKAEAQDCVAEPDEICVPVTWTIVPSPGTETAASCESLDVEHFLTCPQPHAQDTVSGSFTVHGAFTPPGAGWEMVDDSGLSNQFQLTAHLEGFLYDPNLGNAWWGCPSYSRAWMDNASYVAAFFKGIGGLEYPLGYSLSDANLLPPDGSGNPVAIPVALPDQQPGVAGTISFGGTLHCQTSYGTGLVSTPILSWVYAQASYRLEPGMAQPTTFVKYREVVPPLKRLYFPLLESQTSQDQ